jgi:hypothetical protein
MQTYLGFLVMGLVLVYHYVTADPKFEQAAQQSGATTHH